jgi:AcrR family transcriptional regulator
MVRQARSELTRRKIITAAVDLINEVGYPAAGFNDIIDRAEMTKGALYYHFDSKEALATAIITEGANALWDTFHDIVNSSSPALENIVHAIFVLADRFQNDKPTRIAIQLLRVFGGFNEAASATLVAWVAEMTTLVEEARVAGDLRADVQSSAVAEMIVSALLGAELLTHGTPGRQPDLPQRVAYIWETLLPSIVDEDRLEYFREFVAREPLRRTESRPAE